jgi:Protein of unknown function (DUF3579)
MLPGTAEFVVCGSTVDGDVFREPGWAEQLCKTLGRSGALDPQLYSAHVRPVVIAGIAAVVVRDSLKLADEEAFEMVRRFVAEHHLQVRAGRGSRDAEEGELPPEVGHERRSPANNAW